MYMMMEEKEEYVPLNWDKLVKDPAVFEYIKEEMNEKFDADCKLSIISKAKEAGLKDKDIFLPMPKAEPKEEYESVFSDSIGNTIED